VKSLIWGLSLGSGTSGGVLAPVFMIGAALGALEAHVLPDAGPGFWALVGLAAVVGGVMRSPLTGVIFPLELTHAWPALLALLVASSTAYGVSALLLRRSVLTEKIARRGFHLSREFDVDPLEVLFADEVMHPHPTVLRPGDVLPVPPEVLAATVPRAGRDHADVRGPATAAPHADDEVRQRMFPVVDPQGRLLGVVGRHQLDAANGGARVADIMITEPTTVSTDDTLRAVRQRFAASGITAAPVVADGPGEPQLLGLVTVEHLLDGRLPDLAEEHHRARILIGVSSSARPATR
jgi:CBS domain-containing protein